MQNKAYYSPLVYFDLSFSLSYILKMTPYRYQRWFLFFFSSYRVLHCISHSRTNQFPVDGQLDYSVFCYYKQCYNYSFVQWSLFSFIFFKIYFWLCWVFVSVRGLSLVAASGGHSSSWCAGLSLSWPLLLRSTSSRCAGSVVVAHGPSCSTARGIFPDQGSNPCPLHQQADSQPLRHQGSPIFLHF